MDIDSLKKIKAVMLSVMLIGFFVFLLAFTPVNTGTMIEYVTTPSDWNARAVTGIIGLPVILIIFSVQKIVQ